MAGRRDEVEHGVDAVVPEAGVTLDTRLLCKDVVILSLEEANNLREAEQDLRSASYLTVDFKLPRT